MLVSGLVVSGLWIGETVFSAAFGGRNRTELKQVDMERRIEESRWHTIVCGYGTFGKTVAQALRDAGEHAVVIER